MLKYTINKWKPDYVKKDLVNWVQVMSFGEAAFKGKKFLTEWHLYDQNPCSFCQVTLKDETVPDGIN